VVRYQSGKVSPWLAIRNAAGIGLPLALGVIFHQVPMALAIATGALNVAFSDSHEPYLLRARRMLAASLLVGVAVCAGSLCGRNNYLAVFMAGSWAFGAGMLVALSPAAADLGALTLVVQVVYAAVPLSPEKAVSAGLLAVGGGLLQTALALAFWPLRRYVPERRALADLYNELSRAAAAPIHASQAPPASAQSTQAQNALASLVRDHSVEAERYRLLLSQAERMRLALLALMRMRDRIERENASSSEVAIVDAFFAISSQVLATVGDSLQAGAPAPALPGSLNQIQDLAEELRSLTGRPGPPVSALAGDVRFQMDALAGQLRSAIDLAAYATPAGMDAFQRRESRQPWRLRLSGTVATLRANLNLGSAACRHAVRLAVCIALGEGIGRAFALERSYWLPMTIAIVLKPDFSATFSRGLLRLVGTFAGLVFATFLFHVLPAGHGGEALAVTALMLVARWWGQGNYGILVTAITGLVVFLIAMTGVSPKDVIAARGVNTVAGGVIALLAYGLWPTWERSQLAETIARLLDAYRAYFRAIRDSYIRQENFVPHDLDRTRMAARLARSNLEASAERLLAEPGTSRQTVEWLGGLLASTHRLIHALMSLEAGLVSSHPVPPREAFRPFANDVELTLYLLAAFLRGSRLTREMLPDLREDHHALVHSGDALTERYALVNVETDRITNSLNTISEEVLSWRG
jgi:uncharacterized membrane protein YccC